MSLKVTEALRFEYGPMTTELYTAGVDVATYIKNDWNSLPMSGVCSFSMRYSHAYLVNAFGVRGTLYTYFDQLTFDCTSELYKESRPCVNFASAFTACRDLTSESSHSTLSHTWTTCEDFNFRVGYLWVSARVAPLQIQNPTSSSAAAKPLTGHANADELAELFLKHNIFSKPSTTKDGGGRVHTAVGEQPGILACNWKYSNLFPVAYDGVSNVLLAGQYLMSANDQYSFSMQSDCNLVLYTRGLDGQYAWNGLWATMSNISDGFEHKCMLEMQPNGNLVVKDDFGLPRWTSGADTTNVYQVGGGFTLINKALKKTYPIQASIRCVLSCPLQLVERRNDLFMLFLFFLP